MKPFRRYRETELDHRVNMSEAVTAVLTKDGKEFYHQLLDEQLYAYQHVLWAFHKDLVEEWSRREMQKNAPE